GGTPLGNVERLRDVGLPVQEVQVRRLADIGDALEAVGQLTGDDNGGRDAARAYRERLALLRERYRDRRRLRAFYQTETAPAFSVNRDSPISEALDLCGADNVFADLPALAAAVGLESVIAAQPEVVVHSRQEDAAAIARY